MNFLNIKHRITLGLVCLMISSMLLIMVTGIGPNARRATTKGRGQVCESIAFNTSILLSQNELRRMEGVLEALVGRNEDILSAGLRKESGEVACEIGEHLANWEAGIKYSTETHVSVPLRSGEKKWGQVEIRFAPIQARGLIGWITNPQVIYMFTLSVACFFGFSFYLGRVLKQLDPSKAVPKRVRTALDSLAEGLLVTDGKGQIALANEAFAKWAGRESEKLMGKSAARFPWTMIPTNGLEDHDETELPWERALKEKRPVAGFLIKLTECNGEVLTLVANSSPILGAEGRYRGVLTSFENVTDLERHKVELGVARDEADRANREKSEFLARMSHEIRTPMNAILGYTEVLQFGMEQDEDKRQQHLATIQGSGEHLLALINDILDLSKIESGNMQLELTRISLHDVITNVVSVLGMKAQEKNIRLDYEPKGKIPETILTDGVRLKQTIINLVGNAIKFTETGGVLIRPEMTQSQGKTLLAIHVADTGIGMSPEAMEKIFVPFSQADTSITRRFGGTGLGLSICRELAEKLGGEVTVKSQTGHGSIFTVTIDPGDLSDVKMVSLDQIKTLDCQKLDEFEQFQMPSAKVLIVDDAEANRELVALFLKRAGIKYEMAVNGQEAVEMASSGNFDAVLMDMHMPILDGFEATRVLRAQGYASPIIALTADAMAEDERRCRAAGCSDFLTKPIKRERLYERLRIAIGPVSSMSDQNSPQPSELPAPLLEESVADEIVQLSRIANVEIDQIGTGEKSDLDSFEDDQDQGFVESDLPMDDEDFVMIANMFVDHLRLKLDLMEGAAKAKDFKELYELGHWLKGSGGSAGFDHFTQPGKQLEKLAKAKNLKKIIAHVETIRDLSNRIRVVSQVV